MDHPTIRITEITYESLISQASALLCHSLASFRETVTCMPYPSPRGQ